MSASKANQEDPDGRAINLIQISLYLKKSIFDKELLRKELL
jgi:hypothetical protein